jgi:hypothetical protein
MSQSRLRPRPISDLSVEMGTVLLIGEGVSQDTETRARTGRLGGDGILYDTEGLPFEESGSKATAFIELPYSEREAASVSGWNRREPHVDAGPAYDTAAAIITHLDAAIGSHLSLAQLKLALSVLPSFDPSHGARENFLNVVRNIIEDGMRDNLEADQIMEQALDFVQITDIKIRKEPSRHAARAARIDVGLDD